MNHHTPFAIALFLFAGCTGPDAADPPTLIEQAHQSPLMLQRVSALEAVGWTIAPWSAARVETDSAPNPVAESAVVLEASSKDAHVDLVYFPADESIVMRPHDKASAALLEQSISGVSELQSEQAPAALTDEAAAPASTAATGCTRSYWRCQYASAKAFSWACVNFDSNPAGVLQYWTARSGCTWGQAWYGDWHGNAIICPYPNTASTIPVCGM